MAPLTWRNVNAPSFASANQLYSLAANLMNKGFDSASKGLEKFRDITTDEQSAAYMRNVMAAGDDPDAIAAASQRGNSAFLSPDALRFGNNQAGVMLGRENTRANTSLAGVRTKAGQYGLDRSRVMDGRADVLHQAGQEAQPILFQIQEMARNGNMDGAQELAAANSELLGRAGHSAESIFQGISNGFTGGITDSQAGVSYQDFLRNASTAADSRELIDRAGRNFGSLQEAQQAVRDAQAAGNISAQVAQETLTGLESSGLWAPITEADAVLDSLGIAPLGRPEGSNSEWAGSVGLVASESGGRLNALNSEGYGGRLQFGADRLTDAARAGVVPAGTDGAAFSRMSEEDQARVEEWHFNDIDNQAESMGLQQYYGQTIGGVTINRDTIRTMAHIGGIGGVQKFIESNGRYNPSDSNETSISDYGTRFVGQNGPMSFGPDVPRMGEGPNATAYEQMMAAAANDPNRAPLSFGSISDEPNAAVPDVAGGAAPKTAPVVGSGVPTGEGARTDVAPVTTENPEQAARVTAMLERVLADNPEGFTSERDALDFFIDTGVYPEGTKVSDVKTNGSTTIANAANARMEQMMVEAGMVPPEEDAEAEAHQWFQSGGLGADLRQAGSVIGDTVLGASETTANTGVQAANILTLPGRALSKYAIGESPAPFNYVDWNGDNIGTPPAGGSAPQDFRTDAQKLLDEASGTPAPTDTGTGTGTGTNTGTGAPDKTADPNAPTAPQNRPERIDARGVAEEIRTARNTGVVDQAANVLGPMDEALLGENKFQGRLQDIVSQLKTGPLARFDDNDISSAVDKIHKELGVRHAEAAALLTNVHAQTDNDWFAPWNWGSDLDYSMSEIRDMWDQYQDNDGIQGGVARLNNRERSALGRESVDQYQAAYDILNTNMQERLRAATTQAERDRITEYFETQVFPDLVENVRGVDTSGVLEQYSGTSTR
jgi:hypothetical protein